MATFAWLCALIEVARQFFLTWENCFFFGLRAWVFLLDGVYFLLSRKSSLLSWAGWCFLCMREKWFSRNSNFFAHKRIGRDQGFSLERDGFSHERVEIIIFSWDSWVFPEGGRVFFFLLKMRVEFFLEGWASSLRKMFFLESVVFFSCERVGLFLSLECVGVVLLSEFFFLVRVFFSSWGCWAFSHERVVFFFLLLSGLSFFSWENLFVLRECVGVGCYLWGCSVSCCTESIFLKRMKTFLGETWVFFRLKESWVFILERESWQVFRLLMERFFSLFQRV